uniref:Uncharacterized protein n=1 Tax=viral metagenome TaxID=1070528 RepID=A0A6H1ZJH1_9ZZZZ
MKITTIGKVDYALRELKVISKQLSKLDVQACNVGLTDKQEMRVIKLEKLANKIAKDFLGVYAYHQGDPRGCSLYLTEKLTDQAMNYTNGVAIY